MVRGTHAAGPHYETTLSYHCEDHKKYVLVKTTRGARDVVFHSFRQHDPDHVTRKDRAPPFPNPPGATRPRTIRHRPSLKVPDNRAHYVMRHLSIAARFDKVHAMRGVP
jgi:hypothetical protein